MIILPGDEFYSYSQFYKITSIDYDQETLGYHYSLTRTGSDGYPIELWHSLQMERVKNVSDSTR